MKTGEGKTDVCAAVAGEQRIVHGVVGSWVRGLLCLKTFREYWSTMTLSTCISIFFSSARCPCQESSNTCSAHPHVQQWPCSWWLSGNQRFHKGVYWQRASSCIWRSQMGEWGRRCCLCASHRHSEDGGGRDAEWQAERTVQVDGWLLSFGRWSGSCVDWTVWEPTLHLKPLPWLSSFGSVDISHDGLHGLPCRLFHGQGEGCLSSAGEEFQACYQSFRGAGVTSIITFSDWSCWLELHSWKNCNRLKSENQSYSNFMIVNGLRWFET